MAPRNSCLTEWPPAPLMGKTLDTLHETPLQESFEGFLRDVEDRLRYALVAAYGSQRGLEAATDALSYAWENWERIGVMENPAGYVYRVGARLARRQSTQNKALFPTVSPEMPHVEPGLPDALQSLSRRQRAAVVLIHAWGVPYREAADLLGVSAGSIQTHARRGLERLRHRLGVEIDG